MKKKKNELKAIIPGEEQPLICPNCGARMGYHYVDVIKTTHKNFYFPGGIKEGAFSEHCREVKKGNIAYCNKCKGELPFVLKKESIIKQFKP